MVTIMTRIYPVLALVACANVAYAQDNSFLPDAKIPAGSAQTWNVGAGVTQKLLHTNLEWVNPLKFTIQIQKCLQKFNTYNSSF